MCAAWCGALAWVAFGRSGRLAGVECFSQASTSSSSVMPCPAVYLQHIPHAAASLIEIGKFKAQVFVVFASHPDNRDWRLQPWLSVIAAVAGIGAGSVPKCGPVLGSHPDVSALPHGIALGWLRHSDRPDNRHQVRQSQRRQLQQRTISNQSQGCLWIARSLPLRLSSALCHLTEKHIDAS